LPPSRRKFKVLFCGHREENLVYFFLINHKDKRRKKTEEEKKLKVFLSLLFLFSVEKLIEGKGVRKLRFQALQL